MADISILEALKRSAEAGKNYTDGITSDKQDKLIAGSGIVIGADGKTISATGGGGGGSSVVMADNADGGVDLTVDGTTKTIAKEEDVSALNNELTQLNDVIDIDEEDAFYITDSNGYIIMKVDSNGVSSVNVGKPNTPFKDMKLLTLGDSLSAHDNWQKWLVEWLGVTFDNDENINGRDGHAPMAKGGTSIAPTTNDSIYMRALDTKYYTDSENGTVIFIYGGQNDYVNIGTIDDIPYTDKVVTTASNLTFYSSYMGMIENLLADIPSARIFLVTQMPVRLDIGKVGTEAPWEGVVRFPDMESVLAYEATRYKKVEAIRAIANKYSLPCIDLWSDSGINDYNSSYWYGATGGTCGQVHPNDYGYRRMAEVMLAKMY